MGYGISKAPLVAVYLDNNHSFGNKIIQRSKPHAFKGEKPRFRCLIIQYSTVELQWLEHLWDYENLFETGVVRATEGLLKSHIRRHIRDIFSIFFNMKVYCVFSSESPQRGDSNEYTQYTISQYKKENYLKLSRICNHGICSKEPKNEF